jgi:CHAD domain-containing protein
MMQPEIEKSQPRALRPKAVLADEIRRSTVELLNQMRSRLSLRHDANPESWHEIVHQTRVDSKRLRALWRLLKPGLRAADYRRLEKLSKTVASPLGFSRDAHVMQETLTRLATGNLPAEGFRRLQTGLESLAQSGQATDDSVLQEVEWALIQLERAVCNAQLGRVRPKHIRQGLMQICLRGERLAHAALTDHAMEPLHRWRKWVKILLFETEWLLDSNRPVWVVQLKPLGSMLGWLHDLDVLADTLNSARGRFWQADLESLSQQIATARARAIDEIDALAVEIYAKKAKKQAKQLYESWQY